MEVVISDHEIDQALRGLKVLRTDALKRNTLIKIFRSASRPIVAFAKVNAPKNEGGLQQSIAARAGKSKIYPSLLVGPWARRGGYHGHLLETGTKERRKNSGASTGQIGGHYYMERAYRSGEGAAAEKTKKNILRIIDRTLKKHGYK